MADTGRAGRVRVERRLVTARHGALLLDRKDRILTDELERLRLQVGRTSEEWERLAKEAATWLSRASSLDGAERVAAAATAEQAEVKVVWENAVGVRYPEDASCSPPVAEPAGGSSALALAARAHRAAVSAGVKHAAAQRAIRLVSAELTATRIRRRAVENRWIPRLEGELVTIRRRLDEQELEESLRLRWATQTKGHRS
ncbi:MAG: V-type ATP synthase subunit D [Salinibacterium sp.]|nr:V-type ATP synthase subunit D [Salinibacterium sp.]